MNEPTNITKFPTKKPTPGDLEAAKPAVQPDESASLAPKILKADAQGNIKEDPQEDITLTPFKDGTLLRFGPNPQKPGTFIIVDGAQQPVALARNQSVADLLCRAVTTFFQLVRAKEEAEAAKKTAEDVIKAGEEKEKP